MKLKSTTLIVIFFLSLGLQAQVWYPEGVYHQTEPQKIAVDNALVSVAKTGVDGTNSMWQVSINDGLTWIKLPLLKLSKDAEINDIKRYQGMIYLCGNFTFDGSLNSLVRYNNLKWEGLASFKKPGNQLAPINTLDIQNNQLILGGYFYTINGDTLSYIARFNGFKFSTYFTQCKNCDPDNAVLDIASNDSVVAIAGQFTRIANHKSKYLFRLLKQTYGDTFINTPKLLEKIALNGHDIYGVGGLLRDKRLYMANKANTFTEINYNLDSALSINEILIWDNTLIANGIFQINSTTKQSQIIRLEKTTWTDISNNFPGAKFIATGRSHLFACGDPGREVSMWNPNRFIVRFYPNVALVKARVFIDSNNNCIREKNEKAVPKQFIRLQFLNKGVFTNENGETEFMVPNSVQATWRFVVNPGRNMSKSNCSDTVVNKTFYPGVYSDSIQFPLNRIPNINDIRVFIASPRGTQVVKNKKVLYYITYQNVGSNAISGNISLKKSPYFTKEITLPLYKNKLNDSVLVWDYINLQPGEKKQIIYTGYPEDAQFDNQFQFDAQVTCSIANGSSPYQDDDTDSIPQEVNQGVEAFRKDVYPTPAPGDSITYLDPWDRDLRYNISFNNFSNDTVFYAVVIDTLDLNLDMSYIEETGSNKAYYTEVQTDPQNQYKGILIWHFPNIRLAPNPSMDYENYASGSYIGFKVVTKPLSNGYVLRNTASVFYDNQFAGHTNSVYVTLAATGLDDIYKANQIFKVYPNPFQESFTLSYAFQPGDQVRVIDANGKQVYTETLPYDSADYTVHTSHLPDGLYIVQIVSGGQVYSQKLLK